MPPTALKVQNSTGMPVFEMKEKTLIIGTGEIGTSLARVLDSVYYVDTFDIKNTNNAATPKLDVHYKVIHICFPYSDKFISSVQDYMAKFTPNLVIVHSTVPVGTTRKLGKTAVHSPVNGRHPWLEQSIKTFVKFLGGSDVYHTFEAVNHLNKAGIVTHVLVNSEATELAKILCTTQLGVHVVVMKEIAKLCDEYQVPFHEVYTEWNNAYNQGYSKLGEVRFFRPILFPIDGGIGGHCVVPNCDLLPTFLTDLVKKKNKEYGRKRKETKHETRK